MSGVAIPTERQVQRGILDMLGRCFPECFVTHIPNGAHLAGSDTARFKQMGALKGDGLKVGMPDLLVLWPVERGAFIEVKRPVGGKLSNNQFEVHAKLLSLGWRVATVKSVEEVYVFLNDCGAPCRGRLIGVAA